MEKIKKNFTKYDMIAAYNLGKNDGTFLEFRDLLNEVSR